MESVSTGKYQVLEDDGLGSLSLYKRYDTVDMVSGSPTLATFTESATTPTHYPTPWIMSKLAVLRTSSLSQNIARKHLMTEKAAVYSLTVQAIVRK